MSLDRKPVIFLAFANDKSGKEAYLNALKKERIEIQAMLQPAVDEGLCKVVIEPDATPEDIFRVFNQYQNRIVIFHYAGHGSVDGLHLTSEESIWNKMANSLGLAKLFGMQDNLQLVFLNACATFGQIKHIRMESKANVITTLSSIKDDVALDFATQFYQAIGRKATLDDAYKTAVAFIQTTRSITEKDSGNVWNVGLKRTKRPKSFPWQIEGSMLGWSLIKVRGGAMYSDKPEIEVFVAYAPEDEIYRKKLEKHLSTLTRRKKIIKTFSMTDIKAYEETDKILKKQLLNARLILLLVSSDFLANNACFEIEEIAMERHNKKTAAVVPIYVRPIAMDDEDKPEFAKLRGLPTTFNKRFITKWEDEDEAFVHIVKGLRQVIQELKRTNRN